MSWVVNDLGTGGDSPTNLAALDKSNLVVIPTSAAQDSVTQAMQTFNWLLKTTDGDYAHLARRAVLVVNRWWPFMRLFTSQDKIRQRFEEEFGDNFAEVAIFTVNGGIRLAMGLHINSQRIPRRVRVQLKELNAHIAEMVADSATDVGSSQLTHAEELALKNKTQPQVTPDSPSNVTALPAADEVVSPASHQE